MRSDLQSAPQAGGALLAVLFCAALMGMLAAASAHYLTRVTKLRSGEVLGTRARTAAEARVLGGAGSPVHTGRYGRADCGQGSAAAGAYEIHRGLCIIRDRGAAETAGRPVLVGRALPDAVVFPALDYSTVFAVVSACAASASGYQTATGYGFPLTAAAVQSAWLCRDPRPTGRASFVVRSNLEMGSEFFVDSRGREGALVTAALGYMDLAALRAAGRVILIAGGDLHLGVLAAAGAEPPAVTLVSATGVVSVDEVRGNAALSVIAWAGAALPEGYQPLGNDIKPPRLGWEPIGIIDGKGLLRTD